MNIDVEYAIKKDIRNNPVVRQVDEEQKREFRRTVWLALLIVGALLVSAWQHFQVVEYGYLSQRAREALTQEKSNNRQLRVESLMLHAPQTLEQRAMQELHMVRPSAADTIVIERAPAVTAGSDIVAAVR